MTRELRLVFRFQRRSGFCLPSKGSVKGFECRHAQRLNLPSRARCSP